ncbi:hypothetical protein GCK72_007029 [Caenorhabditis remanei]|uniref:Uncharacterized protein n=1 Tax=Caenorhabditis remanei TaxID=31234 RepID=A0A6A5HIW0_CAERE|nr:hypothetical protein GCK72_007029 [Caenorhabditis remanei]KAF1767071.1 hypothetical protein GCK72_007029 [Caenorhabditis remanei]
MSFRYKRFVMRNKIRDMNQTNQIPTASSCQVLPSSTQPPLQFPIPHVLPTQMVNQTVSHPLSSLQQSLPICHSGLANQIPVTGMFPKYPMVHGNTMPLFPLLQFVQIQQLQQVLASHIPGLPPVANQLPEGLNGQNQQLQ